jgi:hypothetical protein
LKRMKDKSFDTPVIIDLDSGDDREVGSIREALSVLADEWPMGKGGPVHEEAKQSCEAALAGRMPVERARDAFSAAAWEAGVFISDIGRMSASPG